MREQGEFRPLCPAHREAMQVSSMVVDTGGEGPAADAREARYCQCSVKGCPQNYSPGVGYFTIARNDDYWVATGSASLRIERNLSQVICGEHKCTMFLESFDAETNVDHFRCAQRGCRQTMEVESGGPPAWWLGEGFFRRGGVQESE